MSFTRFLLKFQRKVLRTPALPSPRRAVSRFTPLSEQPNAAQQSGRHGRLRTDRVQRCWSRLPAVRHAAVYFNEVALNWAAIKGESLSLQLLQRQLSIDGLFFCSYFYLTTERLSRRRLLVRHRSYSRQLRWRRATDRSNLLWAVADLESF